MSLIDDLKQAIAQMEGINVPGSIAQRNNNPGNLRASPYAIGKDNKGYAIFPDVQTGYQALDYQLSLYANRGLTLDQMVNLYAPASDNNDPGNYLNFLMSKLGVGPSTSISALYESSTVPNIVPPDVTAEDTTVTSDAINQTLSNWFDSGNGNGSGGNGPGGMGTVLLAIGLGVIGYAILK